LLLLIGSSVLIYLNIINSDAPGYDKLSTPNTQQYKIPVTASLHQQIIERIGDIQGKSHNFTGALEVLG